MSRCDHAFHVDHNQVLDRWEVMDQDGTFIGHCRDRGAAMELAIHQARHSHGRGEDVMVCVGQPDGHYALAWSS